MRALVSILSSIVLLAIIQASYIAASGSMKQTREEWKEGKHHHIDTSTHHHPHEKTGHHEHQKKKHRDTQHADIKPHHDTEKNKHKQMKQEKIIKPVVPPFFEMKNTHHNRYETQEDEARFPERKVNVRVERVEVHHATMKKPEIKFQESQSVLPKDMTRDIYSHMQGDEPIVEDPNEENEPENNENKKKRKNKNKKNKKSKSEKKQKAGKKERKNKKQANTCEINDDCNGGCCVPKKERKVCKKANFRDLGEKCASSCVCIEGMQCFVSDYKRNGQKKVRKPGKRILGRCVNPDIADETKGYFIGDNVPE